MNAPAYRDIPAREIPIVTDGQGVRATVIAGEALGVKGAVQRPVTAPIFLDVRLPAGTRYAQALPAAHNAFVYVYVYEGEVRVGDRGPAVGSWRMGILTTDAVADGVVLAAERPSRLLLIGGAPLREPIAQHGPFVMNTIAELRRAFDDYAAGRLGAIPAREVAAEEVAP